MDTNQLELVAVDKIKTKLDMKIFKKYDHYKRGMRSAYDELNVLQEFRYEAFGSKIELDMNTKPEGAGRMVF